MPEVEKYFGEKIDLQSESLRLQLEAMLHQTFPRKYKEGMNEKQLMDKLIESIIEP